MIRGMFEAYRKLFHKVGYLQKLSMYLYTLTTTINPFYVNS
jgi:hypothetical protein